MTKKPKVLKTKVKKKPREIKLGKLEWAALLGAQTRVQAAQANLQEILEEVFKLHNIPVEDGNKWQITPDFSRLIEAPLPPNSALLEGANGKKQPDNKKEKKDEPK